VISASRIAVLKPSLLVPDARREVTVDLPTPPFPETMPMTFFTLQPSASFALKSGVPPLREGQSDPQELQFELQDPGVWFTNSAIYVNSFRHLLFLVFIGAFLKNQRDHFCQRSV
jgi:hypothetical protein